MNGYVIALVIHIVGALGFFVALGLEWSSLYQARQAGTVEQLTTWLRVARCSYRVGMPAMIVLLISGIYMMRTVWGHVAWIVLSFGVLVFIVVLVLLLIRPRLAAIERALTAAAGNLSPSIMRLVQHPQLWITLQLRFALALGIVVLMTVKPDVSGALITLGVAGLVGLVAALPMIGRRGTQQTSAT
jgi:hypothetical protein